MNLPATLCEYALSKGKFWDVYDSFFQHHPVDSAQHFALLAKFIPINLQEYSEFLTSQPLRMAETKLSHNYNLLSREDIHETPTLLINDRVYYGKLTSKDISNFIDDVSRVMLR